MVCQVLISIALMVTPCNLEIFTAAFLGHFLKVQAAPFHRSWYRELGDRSNQYLLLESGRGNAKTTIGSVVFSLYNICESDDEEMQVVSRSGGATGTSSKIMARVKRELETNAKLKARYNLRPGEFWGQEHLQVIRTNLDGTDHRIDFYSIGKRSSVRGSRGTVLIDDPQNQDDCRSETVLQRDEEWFLTDVLPVIIQDQRLVFIGTPISPLSLCSKVKRMPGWKVLSFPAEDPVGSGKSAWPEQYPDDFLAQRRATMGIDLYAAEYLCQPRVSGNPVFKPEWFKSYSKEDALFLADQRDGLYITTGMDCAESASDQADETAIVTVGATRGEHPRIYVLDCRAARWTTKEGAEQVFQVFNEHKQHWTGAESRVKDERGDAMIQEIRELERIYGVYVNLYPIRPFRDKVTRAMHVQALFQQGLVHFDMKDRGQSGLIDQLTMFTGDQNYHDDRVDAIVHSLTQQKERGSARTESRPTQSALKDAWT